MDGKDTAVLICSCDNFSDLWQPFFQSFQRNWPDCPYPVYLLSNFKNANQESIQTLNVGKDVSWSKNLINAVYQLEEFDYLFLMVEDGFLYSVIDTEKFLDCINLFHASDGRFMCMMAEEWPSTGLNSFFGEIEPNAPYRCNATFSIWRKQTLLDLLDEDESAWEFEINGSERARNLTKFFNTKQNFFPNLHGVKKGKWMRSTLRKLRATGIEIEVSRPVRSPIEESIEYIYFRIRAVVYRLFPTAITKKLQQLRWKKSGGLQTQDFKKKSNRL